MKTTQLYKTKNITDGYPVIGAFVHDTNESDEVVGFVVGYDYENDLTEIILFESTPLKSLPEDAIIIKESLTKEEFGEIFKNSYKNMNDKMRSLWLKYINQ